MKPIACENCGRVLGKLDANGTLHVKHSSSGIEFIAFFTKILFVCPKTYYNRSGRVDCGQRTMFVNPSLTQDEKFTSREKTMAIA